MKLPDCRKLQRVAEDIAFLREFTDMRVLDVDVRVLGSIARVCDAAEAALANAKMGDFREMQRPRMRKAQQIRPSPSNRAHP